MSYKEVFGGQAAVWELSLDAFIKFQLKRKMLQANGTGAFLKQARRMLKELNSQPDEKAMDEIIASSLQYARSEMQTNDIFKTYDPEAQAVVIGDLVAAFKSLSEGEGEDGKKLEAPSNIKNQEEGVTVNMIETRD